MKRRFKLLLLLVVALLMVSCQRAKPRTLSLLVWEGYADPSFIAGFEGKTR